MFKKIMTWVLVVVLACGYPAIGYFSYNSGVHNGLDMYHRQCYNPGGLVINEEHGTVVMCGPLSQIPEAEHPNFRNNS